MAIYMNPDEYERKRVDCGNWDKKHNQCRVLADGRRCKPNSCEFFMTRAAISESRTNAYKRLATLPEEQQQHIAVKYYDGKMPWRKYRTATFDPYAVGILDDFYGRGNEDV